jgi:hypothetical protein
MPALRRQPPPQFQRDLLLKQLAAMRADYVRTLMRENDVKGLSNNKPQLLAEVDKALRENRLAWDTLIEFLDRHEPYGKQRAFLFEAIDNTHDQWSETALERAVDAGGPGELWNAPVPIAAPDELTLSSVGVQDGTFTVLAIGRRTFRRRVEELEAQVEVPRAGLEVRLYEYVDIRGWVRLELNLATGAAQIRGVHLPQQTVQLQLFEDFRDLLDPWFPLAAFAPLDLAKAIKALHADERTNTPHEALVQAVGYDDPSGLKSAIRSASSTQSVSGHGTTMDSAIDAIRSSGHGADGNFYFLPPNAGGMPNTPLTKAVRAVIYARAGRIDFTKPMEAEELEHVLRRVRVLAS